MTDLPTFDELYQFLREHYLYSRFEGDPYSKYYDYARQVTQDVMESLSLNNEVCIPHFESKTGRDIIFDRSLKILNPDEPPAQIQRRAGHLTHITG